MIVPPRPLGPDATIGILGAGQLGRMLALAAARLGFKCHVLCPDPQSCAFDVVRRVTEADYTDKEALDRFANDVDVVTYEFENVPAETATFLSARKPVLPDPKILATTQDRLAEKTFVTSLGIETAPFAAVDDLAGLETALAAVGRPAVLKTRRFGYDGKGQVTIRPGDDPAVAWAEIGEQPAILEAFVPFEREISVVAARGLDGTVQSFDLCENQHRDHILKVTRVPAAVPDVVAATARDIAVRIAEAFGYVGVLAVEMFWVAEGGGRVLVNEIAPRVHNSGHWTLDGCSVSQFEQHIRAVAGWPLAVPVRHGRSEMLNLIGAEVDDHKAWLAVPGAAVHLYGKPVVRPGRKMGHVNRVFQD
ncbi:MAG: 5-(carboxyamino)imidazole ribonucleotide synthase [Rhodoplanes sp.]|uniref:5-(carboxyamino)imidazole ribonucleotide synthase n=1 Tax=Rhodoplanes sp. TaxID=1968906 RepID=UPI001819C117|nr:5-(carboxyamino)imidazole ribonucleotide synthase [Rhodoplanes sp.]NVO17619.1 5-(carboxyamino)imidazole ribonucleotide synthase [Rhodoplanes sp.]